jgi:hypothetical protein
MNNNRNAVAAKYRNVSKRNLNWYKNEKTKLALRLEKKLINLEAQNARRKRMPLLYKFRANIKPKINSTRNMYKNAIKHLNAIANENNRRKRFGIKVGPKISNGLRSAYLAQKGTNLAPGPAWTTARRGNARQQNNTLSEMFKNLNATARNRVR